MPDRGLLDRRPRLDVPTGWHGDLEGLDRHDHPQYQLTSEKGDDSGYAELGSDGLVPQDQLGTGSQDGTKFLRDDGTWQLPVAGPTFVYKTANETVTSSAVLQDDNHLLFTLAADGIYAFEAFLRVEGHATPDFQYQWVEPDGTWDMEVFGTASSSVLQIEVESTGAVIITLAPRAFLCYRGMILAGAAGGTFKLQWAQAVSDVNGVTVEKGSWLSYKKLN